MYPVKQPWADKAVKLIFRYEPVTYTWIRKKFLT